MYGCALGLRRLFEWLGYNKWIFTPDVNQNTKTTGSHPRLIGIITTAIALSFGCIQNTGALQGRKRSDRRGDLKDRCVIPVVEAPLLPCSEQSPPLPPVHPCKCRRLPGRCPAGRAPRPRSRCSSTASGGSKSARTISSGTVMVTSVMGFTRCIRDGKENR